MTTAVDDRTCEPSTAAHALEMDVAEDLSAVLKAIADPLRLRMLSFLGSAAQGEACVCDLADLTDVSQPTVSHHLKLLRDAGLVVSERRGTWVWYRLSPAYQQPLTTVLESLDGAARIASAAPPLPGPGDVEAALAHLVDDLTPRFADVQPAVVERTVRESHTALARTAHLSGHLLNLTERFAKQRLTDLSRRPQEGRPQILFLCVANAGRSQLAAALVHRYAGDRVVVRSAGSTPAAQVHPQVRAELVDLGTPPDEAYPKPLTDDAVRAADVIVTMGCGDVCPVLPGKRYEDWLVGDPALASPAGVTAIRRDLDARVRRLLADLLPDLQLPTT